MFTMALQGWITSSLIFIAHLHLASAPALHYSKTESFRAEITKSITLTCSAFVGVPSDFASNENTMQIYFTDVSGKEMVVASMFSGEVIKVGEDFQYLAPQARVQGNRTGGWMQVSIPVLTENTLGIYKCVILKLDGNTGYITFNRSITIGYDSKGTISSHPPGFQIQSFNSIELQCMGNPGCFCYKPLTVELCDERNKTSSKNQDTARFWCENNLKNPFAEVSCYISVKCGAEVAQLNCTRKELSSPFKFTCGQGNPSNLINESTQNTTERSLTPGTTTQDEEPSCGFSKWHFLWIIPVNAMAAACLTVLLLFFIIRTICNPFSLCGFDFDLRQYFNLGSILTTANPCAKDKEPESIKVDSSTKKENSVEESQALLPEAESDQDPTAAGNAAAAVVMLKKPRDSALQRRKPVSAVQDEEADIDTKL